jgi:LAO/AO transport system kinase
MRASKTPELTVGQCVSGVLAGDITILARTISLIESTKAAHRVLAREVLGALGPRRGRAGRVGVTGVPGVGKSTFIDALGTHITRSGRRVAVLAVDPSSRLSGGSILADKTRMARLSLDPLAYVRPSPNAGTLGGVARATHESVLLCEAAGFDFVLVETVGVGQSETAVACMVDFCLALMLPGSGDELQGIKRGLVELVDLIAVNKADGDSANAASLTAQCYRNALHCMAPRHPDWVVPVMTCSAQTGVGIAELWNTIERRIDALRSSGALAKNRGEQAACWLDALLNEELRREFEADARVMEMLPGISAALRAGTLSPGEAAELLLAARERSRAERTTTI